MCTTKLHRFVPCGHERYKPIKCVEVKAGLPCPMEGMVDFQPGLVFAWTHSTGKCPVCYEDGILQEVNDEAEVPPTRDTKNQ